MVKFRLILPFILIILIIPMNPETSANEIMQPIHTRINTIYPDFLINSSRFNDNVTIFTFFVDIEIWNQDEEKQGTGINWGSGSCDSALVFQGLSDTLYPISYEPIDYVTLCDMMMRVYPTGISVDFRVPARIGFEMPGLEVIPSGEFSVEALSNGGESYAAKMLSDGFGNLTFAYETYPEIWGNPDYEGIEPTTVCTNCDPTTSTTIDTENTETENLALDFNFVPVLFAFIMITAYWTTRRKIIEDTENGNV